MADLDFDQLEKLIDGEEQRGTRDRSRSQSPDRRRSSDRRTRDRSRDRYSSPDRRDYRSGDRDYRGRDRGGGRDYGRDRSPARRESRSRRYQSRTPSPIRRQKRDEERKIRQLERERKAAEEKARRSHEDAKRDEMTVIIMNLSLKANEDDVYKFLTENCGKVRDIHIVRDARSNKSKGVAYVEFYEHDAIMRAFNISGQAYILGQAIRIQASQAEKNRAAKIAKQQAQEILAVDGPMKVYVGGLVGRLASIEVDELQQLFGPFGTITRVDFQKDQLTGKSKGFAFLYFSKSSDARDAIQAMNGFEIAGQQIKVGHAADGHQPPQQHTREPTSLEKAQQRLLNAQRLANGEDLPDKVEDPNLVTRLEDEENGSMLHGDAKVALMRKLARDRIAMPTAPQQNVFRADVTMVTQPSQGVAAAVEQVQAAVAAQTGGTGGVDSKNFVLYPLFSKAEVDTEGIELLEDIVEDVRDELENIGAVQAVYIDDKALDGRVYVRFVHREHALAAAAKMSGRKYSGNTIQLSWINDQAWMQCTGKSL